MQDADSGWTCCARLRAVAGQRPPSASIPTKFNRSGIP